MDTNEFIIQLRGKAAIERPLQMGREYEITSRVSVTQVKDTDNHDGTINKTFVVEPIISELKNELGDKIEFKRKGKMSQALRYAIIMWARDQYPDMDDEAAYEMVMSKLLNHIDSVLPLIMKQNGE